MSILETFVLNLQEYFIGKRDVDYNIIGLHPKRIEQVGEVRFPLHISNWSHLLEEQVIKNCNTIFDFKHPKKDEKSQIAQLKSESLNWQVQIAKVIISEKKTHVDIFISRTSMIFETVLKEALDLGSKYGSSDIVKSRVHLETYPTDCITSESSLSCLRLHLLKEVTRNLLEISSCSAAEKQSVVTLSSQPVRDSPKNIICGPVLSEKGTKNLTTVQELYEKRAADMRMMAQHKYGVQVKPTPIWEEYFTKMGKGCATIEMLSNKPQKPIKVTQNDLQTAHKGPCFIFYNCARLAVLFKEFEKLVSGNAYPGLPEINTVDFSLLSQNEEWELFYVYILQYPIVVKNSIRHIEKGLVNPQYIVTFLSNLTSLFSVYYRRVRILTNPREHMFAVIHARIYLLKAVQQIFHNALALLNIEPVSKM